MKQNGALLMMRNEESNSVPTSNSGKVPRIAHWGSCVRASYSHWERWVWTGALLISIVFIVLSKTLSGPQNYMRIGSVAFLAVAIWSGKHCAGSRWINIWIPLVTLALFDKLRV
jgi:hypothetical protein